SIEAGFTARATAAATTIRRRVTRPVSISTSATTATAQPAYVTFGTLNDAPTASRRSAASAPSVTSRQRAVSTPAPYLISSSATASRVAARRRASDSSLAEIGRAHV